MVLKIDIKEELHLPQFNRCPTAVQRDFRDAFEDLQTASVSDVKNGSFDFIERSTGRPVYRIVSTAATDKYVIIFEIEETSDNRDLLRVLQVGKENDLLNK